MEYLNVTQSEFDDILDVLQERGLAPRYSIEDSENGGTEYHIHSHIEEIEEILWSIQMVAAFSPKNAVDIVIERLEVASMVV